MIYVVVLESESGTKVWAKASKRDAERMVRYLSVQHADALKDLGSLDIHEVEVE